jgi:hypothetical protein
MKRASYVTAFVIVLTLGGLLICFNQKSLDAERRMRCSNNLKSIALAIHSYHDANKRIPRAIVSAPNGTAQVPYLIQSHYDIYC